MFSLMVMLIFCRVQRLTNLPLELISSSEYLQVSSTSLYCRIRYLSVVYTYDTSTSISASISTRVFTRATKNKHPQAQGDIGRRSAFKFWSTLHHPIWRTLSCACACVIPVYTSDAISISASTRKRKYFLLLCLCLHLCLRRPGLHVHFLCLLLASYHRPECRDISGTFT